MPDPWDFFSQFPMAAAVIYVVKMLLDRHDRIVSKLVEQHEQSTARVIEMQEQTRDAVRELASKQQA